jgi:hypothetical protein
VRRPTLSARDQRALRIGVLVAGPVLAWVLAVQPYWQAERETAEQLASERRLLARELGVLGARQHLDRLDGEASRRLADVAPRFFAAGPPGESAAALVEYVAATADSADVELTQMDPGPPAPEVSGVATVVLAVRGHGDMAGLLTLIRGLEHGAKLVRLDTLEVRVAADAGDSGADGAAAEDAGSDPLTFRIGLSGFVVARSVARPPATPVPLRVGMRAPAAAAPGPEPRP